MFSVGPAFSQTEGKDENLSPFRFTTSVDAVHLSVSVVNKKGKLVTDLEQSDFWVLENDVIQDITYFSRGTDAPVDVVMLVDASGSMDVTEKALNARNSAIQLIRGLGEEDRVAVYAFDRDLYRLTDFTKSKEDAIAALTRIEPFGSTALYDAVVTLSEHVVHQGFGRRAIAVGADEVEADVIYQVGAIAAFATAHGVALVHVKPHGALYNQAVSDRELSRGFASGIARVSRDLIFVGLASSQAMREAAEACKLRYAGEAFADRVYNPDGTLQSRAIEGSVITDPERCAAQAVSIAVERRVIAHDGTSVSVEAETLCLHGDNPAALDNARTVRAALENNGVELRSLSA